MSGLTLSMSGLMLCYTPKHQPHLTKVEEGGQALGLLHVAVQRAQRDTWPQPPQRLVHVPHLLARAHEYDDLALHSAE